MRAFGGQDKRGVEAWRRGDAKAYSLSVVIDLVYMALVNFLHCPRSKVHLGRCFWLSV